MGGDQSAKLRTASEKKARGYSLRSSGDGAGRITLARRVVSFR